MKTLTPFIQGFALFSGLSWLSHLGTAYALLRLGVVWSFLLLIIVCAIYGLCMVAKGFMAQQGTEAPSMAAVLVYAVPAVVLLIIVVFGGITGVITGL